MASVNIMKLHGGEAAAILGHTHRHDGRAGVSYRNEHVDAERSHLNSVLVFKGQRAEDAQAELARLRARVEEIDRAEPPKRVRKDRVTLVSFEVPVPDGLPADKEDQFFKLAFGEIARMCGGGKNCGVIRIHRDEVHEYLDPVTKETRTSRVHAHMVGIPYVKGKGVNCKSFMSRQALRDIQKAIDDRCRQELGVAFMDGSRQRSRGKVEDLKIASARAEREEQYLAELRQQCRDAQDELISAQQALMAEQERTEALRASQRRLQASVDALRAEAGKLEGVLPYMQQLGSVVDMIDRYDHALAGEVWSELRSWGIDPDVPEVQERYRRHAEDYVRIRDARDDPER